MDRDDAPTTNRAALRIALAVGAVAVEPFIDADRILKGTAASALPIEQPTILELVVNAGVAKRLGVAVPRAVLARADRIIG